LGLPPAGRSAQRNAAGGIERHGPRLRTCAGISAPALSRTMTWLASARKPGGSGRPNETVWGPAPITSAFGTRVTLTEVGAARERGAYPIARAPSRTGSSALNRGGVILVIIAEAHPCCDEG